MLHEVDFQKWCPQCEHYKLAEKEDPCHDCLNEPTNDDSRKPVMFKAADKEEKTVNKASKAGTVVRTRKLSVTGKPI